MRDVDWLSVFKDNAQEVRVKISCRDPSKIPIRRLFEFHKNLFILGFIVETLLPANDEDDLLGEDLEDQNRRNGGDGNGNNGDRGVDNGGRSDAPPNNSLGGVGSTNNNQTGGANRTRMTRDLGNSHEQEGPTSASAVYQMLVQKGVINKEGYFVWDKSEVEDAVIAETGQFWAKETTADVTFQQRLEDAVEAEISLPDNIMPDFEDPAAKLALSKIHKEKKQKWGPVQAVRQSSRIDRSKNIMEKAKERKRKTNLEIPKMKGMMCSNPFTVLPIHELDARADKVGISIIEEFVEVEIQPVSSSSSSSRPISGKDRQEDLEEYWTEVVKKSRGKHPRKKFQ
jgi:hypothetical protein